MSRASLARRDRSIALGKVIDLILRKWSDASELQPTRQWLCYSVTKECSDSCDLTEVKLSDSANKSQHRAFAAHQTK